MQIKINLPEYMYLSPQKHFISHNKLIKLTKNTEKWNKSYRQWRWPSDVIQFTAHNTKDR